MIKWHLEIRAIKDLKPHPKNPRQLSKDQARQITASLETFGMIEKPIINQDNTIIGGHQRITILKKEGLKEIECWVPERLLEEKEVNELCIRLNKNTGEFDFDVLANEWEITDLINWGFDPDDLDMGDIDKIDSEDKPSKENKLKMCPQCGHEF